MTIPLQALSLVEKAEPVRVRLLHTMLEGPSEHENERWMESRRGLLHGIDQMNYVSWSLGVFSKPWHLLEVGLTRNWETMSLRMLTAVGLFYFIMCEDPHE